MQGVFHIINSDEKLTFAHNELDRCWGEKHWLELQINQNQKRSKPQNNSMQRYCGLVAKALNDSGQERKVKTPIGDVEVPWTQPLVREIWWRPIQIALTGEVSTTEPSRKEYIEIYEVMNRHLAESKGIHVPWPESKDR